MTLFGTDASTRSRRVQTWIRRAEEDAVAHVDDPGELRDIELALDRAAQAVREARGPDFTPEDFDGWTDLRGFAEHNEGHTDATD